MDERSVVLPGAVSEETDGSVQVYGYVGPGVHLGWGNVDDIYRQCIGMPITRGIGHVQSDIIYTGVMENETGRYTVKVYALIFINKIPRIQGYPKIVAAAPGIQVYPLMLLDLDIHACIRLRGCDVLNDHGQFLRGVVPGMIGDNEGDSEDACVVEGVCDDLAIEVDYILFGCTRGVLRGDHPFVKGYPVVIDAPAPV